MRLIESYGPFSGLVQGYPAPCLLESDDDASRILVVRNEAQLSDPFVLDAQRSGACVFYNLETDRFSLELGPHAVWVPSAEVPNRLDAVRLLKEWEASVPQPPSSRFVHLHTHSEYSGLDGLSTVQEIVDRVAADNQPAVAITDHGVCAAHPHLQRVAIEAGIKPIFGIEAYFVNDRMRRSKGLGGAKKSDLDADELAAYEEDQKAVQAYWHLILWAQNDVGLRNLWAMSTEANRDGFYRHPRMDWETLRRYSDGVMCSTACLRGPVADAILKEDYEGAITNLGKLQWVFPDRLWVELHTNQLAEQKVVNEALVNLAHQYSLPTIAVSDSHYSCQEHSGAHKLWIAMQTGKTVNDDSDLFSGDCDYHVMTEAEVRDSLSYLPQSVVDEAVNNTSLVAEQCTAALAGNPTPPVFNAEGDIADDVDKLVEMCVGNFPKCTGKSHPMSDYYERFEMEIKLLIEKRFCGYFRMVADYCRWAKAKGILVGPGRGSGGGSLVAYLSGITEIDPVETDLLFERFMTKGRKELPDFDVDFPSSRINEVLEYISNKWGADSVVRVGTHLRLKNRGVVRKLASALKDSINIQWGDIEMISKIIDKAESSSAGLGISWDELWTDYEEELRPYKVKYPSMFSYADTLVGRLNAYGKHAAGVVIAPGESLVDLLPLRVGEDGRLVSEFDMEELAALGLVKFDFLAITTLDTLQKCIDLVEENRGIKIDIYNWNQEYHDQDVWDYLSAGNTKGCFQIETPAGTKITKDVRPKNLHDLADVITLDRPGPMRSGLDRAYLRRRHGSEEITYADPRLKGVLDRSYGVLLYQEDIMKTCMVLAGYDDEEADKVRKILGKKKIELVRAEGEKFLSQAIDRGMDRDAAHKLWAQMEEFSRYAFNRAHAYGYAMLAHWTAYLKFYYPQEFYVAAMSTLDTSRMDKIGHFVMEARQRGFQVLPPDINESREEFTIVGDNIRYGLRSIKGIGESAVTAIIAGQPYDSYADFRDRKPVNIGVAKLLVRIGAFDSFGTDRRTLEAHIEQEESGVLNRCVHWNGSKVGAPNDLPCEFDWDSEPVAIGVRGKPLQRKKIPAKCTVKCRNYEKCSTPPPINTEPYTEAEIRRIEMDLLGVHLSSTPFDLANKLFGDQINTASSLEAQRGCENSCVLAIVQKVREKLATNNKPFGIVSLFAQDGTIDAFCFDPLWTEHKKEFKENAMMMCLVTKNDRGYRIVDAAPAEKVIY